MLTGKTKRSRCIRRSDCSLDGDHIPGILLRHSLCDGLLLVLCILPRRNPPVRML